MSPQPLRALTPLLALLALDCGGAQPSSDQPGAPQKLAAGPPPAASPEAEPIAPAAPLDSDADGALDGADQCPVDPEDRDNYLDDDGCPEPDNDADAIPDIDDKCPNEPETYNGREDADGCPDFGLVIINSPPPQYATRVSFARSSSKIRAADEDTLEVAIQVMAEHPEIGRVLVVGYASEDEGPAKTRIALSLKRAEAVIARLVKGGVSAARLVPAGYGDLCGFDGGHDEAARTGNRVVEFKILKRDGAASGLEFACPAAVAAGLVPEEARGSGMAAP